MWASSFKTKINVVLCIVIHDGKQHLNTSFNNVQAFHCLLDTETGDDEVAGWSTSITPFHTAAHMRSSFVSGDCQILQCTLSCDETGSMCDASTSWRLRSESTTPSARTQSATWCVPNFWLARCLLLFCASERSWQENVPDWGFMYATSHVFVWPYLGPVPWEYKMSPRERVSIDINHSETDALTFMT